MGTKEIILMFGLPQDDADLYQLLRTIQIKVAQIEQQLNKTSVGIIDNTTIIDDSGAIITDHGLLGGLEDPDHTSYLFKTGWDIGVMDLLTLSFVNATRTFTVTPSAETVYYIQGVKYTLESADSKVISDVEGFHFIYFDGTTLSETTSTWVFSDYTVCLVGIVWWDLSASVQIGLGWECHTNAMDRRMHGYLHNTFGTRFSNGLVVSDGAATGQIALTAGTIYDEDIKIDITLGVGGSTFEQDLADPAKVPIFYRSGTGDWNKLTADSYPAHVVGTDLVRNNYSDPNWTLVNVAANQYSAMWLIATNDVSEPIIAVIGQGDDGNLINARANNQLGDMDFGDLPTAEWKVIARLIIQEQAASPYFNIQAIDDYRYDLHSPVIGAVSSQHNNLGGLQGGTTDEYYHITLTEHTNNMLKTDSIADLTGKSHTDLDDIGINTHDQIDTFLGGTIGVSLDITGTVDISGDITLGDDIIITNNIRKDDNISVLNISGGNVTNAGANLNLYGGDHATLSNDIKFRVDAANVLFYDHSATKWDLTGHLEISGNVGFYGTNPAAQPAAYTPSNVSTDRSFDANSTTVEELADVLGTLITDLQTLGLLQ